MLPRVLIQPRNMGLLQKTSMEMIGALKTEKKILRTRDKKVPCLSPKSQRK